MDARAALMTRTVTRRSALLGAAAAFNPWQAWLRLADPFGFWQRSTALLTEARHRP